MTTEKCSDCRFWQYFDECDDNETALDEDGLGTCRRFPPSNGPDGALPYERPFSPNKWQHPCTAGSDWCGEFKEKAVAATPTRSE